MAELRWFEVEMDKLTTRYYALVAEMRALVIGLESAAEDYRGVEWLSVANKFDDFATRLRQILDNRP